MKDRDKKILDMLKEARSEPDAISRGHKLLDVIGNIIDELKKDKGAN